MIYFPHTARDLSPDLQKDHPPQNQKYNYTSMLRWPQTLPEAVTCVDVCLF